jgi:hypothetical protein
MEHGMLYRPLWEVRNQITAKMNAEHEKSGQ